MRDLMASRARPILRLLRRDERGAIGVLVAIFIGAGVLTGMGALVIDVGRLYQERAELQNGADAAALGVAKSCALGTCAPGVAPGYADANASRLTGGSAAVGLVCGSGNLAVCPAPTGAKTDCPAAPSAGIGYVQVYTSTQTSSGSTLLPPIFARTLLGNSGDAGTTVSSCSQAVWGAPSAATTAAVTISACEWDQATQQGTFPAPPADQVLMLNNTGANNNGCATEPAGSDGPASFGWAAHPAGNCTLPVGGPSFPGRTQMRVSFSCQLVLSNAQQTQTPILVPVYVSVNGVPGNITYVLKGFADFVVTGYHMPGFDAADWLNPANDCAGTDYCLNGYFTQGIIPTTGSLGGTDLGASVIELTG
jgi:Flp pilus assembly protein TadG